MENEYLCWYSACGRFLPQHTVPFGFRSASVQRSVAEMESTEWHTCSMHSTSTCHTLSQCSYLPTIVWVGVCLAVAVVEAPLYCLHVLCSSGIITCACLLCLASLPFIVRHYDERAYCVGGKAFSYWWWSVICSDMLPRYARCKATSMQFCHKILENCNVPREWLFVCRKHT